MANAIVINNLTKQYPVPLKRDFVNAVDNLNLTVGEGEIFGFLGANGAGKTTTIKILLGLIFPTTGEATVLGKPAGDIEVKHRISYLPESPYFYEHMTAVEVVTFYAQLFGMKREDARKKAEKLVDDVGLGARGDRNKRIMEFSKGMRQRVGIAQSLINDPTLLFYDEPTSGLDAIARRDIRDLMLGLKEQGKSMFLSSHQLEDVEAVCHRVSIIHKGKLQVVGTVSELTSGEYVTITVSGVERTLGEQLRAIDSRAEFQGTKAILTVGNDDALVSRVIDLVRGTGGSIVSVIPKRRTLEDLFVEVVGERLVVGDGVATTERVDRSNGENGSGNGYTAVSSAAAADVPTTSVSAASASDEDTATVSAGAAPRKPAANKYKELHRK